MSEKTVLDRWIENNMDCFLTKNISLYVCGCLNFSGEETCPCCGGRKIEATERKGKQ